MKINQVGNKNLILVIDDDEGRLESLTSVLESEELQPICCRTGKQALEAVNQHDVNVAILDLRLTDIGGFEVLKQLKEQNPEIKVIINTANASLKSVLTAINEQAFAYVKKMGNVEELLGHVRRAFHVHYDIYSDRLEQEVKKRTTELRLANKKLKKENIGHKQLAKELRDSEERIKKILTNISMILWTIDKNYKITFLGGKGLSKIGLKPEELIGESALEMMAKNPEAKKLIDVAMSGKETVGVIESGVRE